MPRGKVTSASVCLTESLSLQAAIAVTTSLLSCPCFSCFVDRATSFVSNWRNRSNSCLNVVGGGAARESASCIVYVATESNLWRLLEVRFARSLEDRQSYRRQRRGSIRTSLPLLETVVNVCKCKHSALLPSHRTTLQSSLPGTDLTSNSVS